MTTLQGPAWKTDNRPATSSGVEQTGATKKGKQCRNVHSHHIHTNRFLSLKQEHFWTRCKRRAFPEKGSLEVLTAPVPFPSLQIIFKKKKKKSRACSFESCFLSSLLHPPLISPAFVAGLLPPAERAGREPGTAPAMLLDGLHHQPPPVASSLPHPAPQEPQISCQKRGSGDPSPPQWGVEVLGRLPPSKGLVGREVSSQGMERWRIWGIFLPIF